MVDKPGLCMNCKKPIVEGQHWVQAYGGFFHKDTIGKCKGFKNLCPKFYEGVDID